ncbi:2-phospho-L-lactate guanylyltransferase [Sphingomonas sp. SUN039]|uniref:2-phospho-L-lactate guanylyltransferase n=1 Tax=Sphingomonas sp. SUN039 TaxID=2937787 RepID=UPI00216455FB|nr:2-phospho-L-lactate guanylyltransferase [Sphingomonas sp. SUN039]UVO54245.1 2-phospho-L-lactate guanylyltransferase [Sphingomonas sp. SUN039]
MTGWTAIVPLNLGRDCKTRLAGRLSRAKRDLLVAAMADHVVAQLRAAKDVERIVMLSPETPQTAGVVWARDCGRGLNAELALLFGQTSVLVVHADLPLLGADDIGALIVAAEAAGAAIAPDRTGTGTNGLALASAAQLIPCFGEGSFARHRALLSDAAVVERAGLALDIDTPDDLDAARASGALPIACPI